MEASSCPEEWVDCTALLPVVFSDLLNALGATGTECTDQRCCDACDAIEAHLAGSGLIYWFGSHAGDDGSSIVIGEVDPVDELEEDRVLGLRTDYWASSGLSARRAPLLHEGAHVAQMGEADAQWVEDNCGGGQAWVYRPLPILRAPAPTRGNPIAPARVETAVGGLTSAAAVPSP